MSVRRAVPGDEALVRGVRLAALAESPDAFESTHEREAAFPTAEWQRWISTGATFIFEQPDGTMGIAVGVWHRDDPAAVLLISVWVHTGIRGTGAADALVRSVLEWAEGEGAAGVWLHVVKGDERARRLYERNGFRATGAEVRRERDGVAEVEMRHPLGRRGGQGE